MLTGVKRKNRKTTSIPLTADAIRLFKSVEKVPDCEKVFHRSPDYVSSLLY